MYKSETSRSASAQRLAGERGQAIIFEFMLALLIFLIAWSYLGARFDERMGADSRSVQVESMRLKADYVLETLVKTNGTPNGWETMQIADVNSIGLALDDRQLSEAKLAAFVGFSSSYDQLRSVMGIGEYDFYFQFEGADDVNAGLPPIGNATTVVASRLAYYKGGVGVATLKLYKLET